MGVPSTCSGLMYAGVPTTKPACGLQVRLLRDAEDLGDAEVEHLDDLHAVDPREEDVGRLEVAVDDARRVGAIDAAGHLPEHVRHLRRGEPTPALQALLQALALEQLHRHEGEPPVRPVVEDLHHVRAAELRRRPRLELEAAEQLPRVRPVGRVDQLDRDGGAQRHVIGEPHLPHGPRAERRAQPVTPADQRAGARHEWAAGCGGRRGPSWEAGCARAAPPD